MDDTLLIGLDLGTTFAKAAAYDLRGRVIAEAKSTYPTYYEQPGWAEQSPSDWKSAVTTCMREMVAALGERRHTLAGIGVATHGPCLLFVDEHGQSLLERCPIWQDERCSPQGQRFVQAFGAEWTGLGTPQTSLPPRLLWLKETYPSAAKTARYALTIKGYLLHWLTGQFATEPSSGPGRAEWWEPVFEWCGWPIDKLPPIRPPTAILGELSPARVSDFGLDESLPVVMGTNDGAAATLATGAVRPHEVNIALSTNGVVRVVFAELPDAATRMEHELFSYPYVENLWISGAHTRVGASAVQWLADVIREDAGTHPSSALVEQASHSPPGSRGVIFLPFLMKMSGGQREPQMGTISGLSLSIDRADVMRAALEGVSFALRQLVDVMSRQVNQPPDAVKLSGGGAGSALWRQILTNVLNLRVIHYAQDSTLGAAIVVSVGLDFVADFAEAFEAMVHLSSVTQPEPEDVAVYAQSFKRFQHLQNALADVVSSAWSPPR